MTGDHITSVRAAAGSALTRLHETQASLAHRAQAERGATMVEYALLLVLVLLAAFLSVKFFGDTLVALFDASANTMESAPNVNPTTT